MTDPIFANVRQINREADADPQTLRISVDTKAAVNLGEYSRGGKSRGREAVKALDHDLARKEKLIPGGLLEPMSGRSFLFSSAPCGYWRELQNQRLHGGWPGSLVGAAKTGVISYSHLGD